MNPYTVVDQLTHPKNPLSGLVTQAKYLATINLDLHRHLGPPVNRYCRMAALRGDTAILQVDSSVWLSKIRFLSPDILAFLKTHLGPRAIRKMRIRVGPPVNNRPGKPSLGCLRLSPHAAECIRSTASTTDNPPLQAALLRLAANESPITTDGGDIPGPG